MRFLFGTLFLILAIFSQPSELMLKRFFTGSNPKIYEIYSHRYRISKENLRVLRPLPGTSIKVGLDEYRKHIIGYAEPGYKGYTLLPFVERGPYKGLGEQRIKMIIDGEDARHYDTIVPADKLNELFFEKVHHLAEARVVAHPNPDPELWD